MALRRLQGGGHGRALFVLAAALLESLGSCAELHYGLVIDAGSSGSRIHVHSYRTGGDAGEFELVEDLLLKVKPGLSAKADDPQAAADSLRGLMEYAAKKVPKSEQAHTPVFLMASAGLRKLPEEKSNAILEKVRDTLFNSPFLFKREWAYIMSGREEGIFGWVTVNYLMKALNDNSKSTGVIDLGGGSAQMVYHMPSGASAPDDWTGKVVHGGSEHKVYVATHNGKGLDHARDRLYVDLGINIEGDVENPCLSPGHKMDRKIDLAGNDHTQSYIGTGSFEACATQFRQQFHKDEKCDVKPCVYGGMYQPELPARIFGFSYLFDRTRAIGLLDGKVEEFGTQQMSIKDIEKAAKALCSLSPTAAAARFAKVEDAEKWFNFCGDVAYLTVLLHDGLGIPREKELTMGNKMNDVEIVWTLGAIIAKRAPAQAAALEMKRGEEL